MLLNKKKDIFNFGQQTIMEITCGIDSHFYSSLFLLYLSWRDFVV